MDKVSVVQPYEKIGIFHGTSWDFAEFHGIMRGIYWQFTIMRGDRSFDFNQELTCFDLNRDFSEAFWMGEEN